MKNSNLLYGVPVYANEHFTYIKFSDIPDNLKESFEKFMNGQTCSVINGESVVYSHDWERFILGKPIID